MEKISRILYFTNTTVILRFKNKFILSRKVIKGLYDHQSLNFIEYGDQSIYRNFCVWMELVRRGNITGQVSF